jgi:hypothetical protein
VRFAARNVAALCLTALTLTVAYSPPRSGGNPWILTSVSTWGGADCASGRLDGLDGFPVLEGEATRCDDVSTSATFAVIWFDANRPLATTGWAGVRPYNPGGQPRRFGVAMPSRAGT